MRISDWSSDVCSSDLAAFDGLYARFQCKYIYVLNRIFPRRWGVAASRKHQHSDQQQPFHDNNSASGITLWTAWTLLLGTLRSEEHTSELQSLMRISYAVFCLKKKRTKTILNNRHV